MDDTWFSRELPVLKALLRIAERNGPRPARHVSVDDIADEAQLGREDIEMALWVMDGAYVDYQPGGFVREILPSGRRAAGQWPSPESMLDRLVAALAAEESKISDPETRGKIRQALEAISGTGRDVFVGVITTVLSRQMGVG